MADFEELRVRRERRGGDDMSPGRVCVGGGEGALPRPFPPPGGEAPERGCLRPHREEAGLFYSFIFFFPSFFLPLPTSFLEAGAAARGPNRAGRRHGARLRREARIAVFPRRHVVFNLLRYSSCATDSGGGCPLGV